MGWPAFLVSALTAWSLSTLDATTARTTIRLWHELYTARGIPHDFVSLIAPDTNSKFVGAVRYNEICAIAVCDPPRDDVAPALVRGVARHPDQPHAIHHLVELSLETACCWKSVRDSHPRVHLEVLWLLPENTAAAARGSNP